MIIDAHQHFWMPSRGDYGWLTPALPTLYRSFLPEDLAPLMQARAIDGAILVQAAATEAETDFLLGLADSTPFVRAVVGWIDLAGSDPLASLIRVAAHPCFRGIRPMLQDDADIRWLLEPRLTPLFEALISRDLTFDALIRPHQLPVIAQLLERYPALRLVVDHGAKPAIADSGWEPSAQDLRALAGQSGAFVKVSGLLTEAGSAEPQSVRPYADHLLECFGPERLMWGSDWPVLLQASDYLSWFDTAWDWWPAHRERIFGGNAETFYRIGTGS